MKEVPVWILAILEKDYPNDADFGRVVRLLLKAKVISDGGEQTSKDNKGNSGTPTALDN